MVTHNQNNFCHNSKSARKTETETLFFPIANKQNTFSPRACALRAYARFEFIFFEFYFV